MQNPFDGFDCFPKGEVENVKLMLMTMASHTGITPEEYAAFIAQGGMSAFQERRVNAYVDEYLNNSCSNPEEKALPDADQKSLRLKIQMKGVSKPPMWREIVIPADFNFFQLHLAIQAVMGLYDAHLWQFQHKAYDSDLQIGIPADDNDGFGLYEYTNDANSTPVTSYLSEKETSWNMFMISATTGFLRLVLRKSWTTLSMGLIVPDGKAICSLWKTPAAFGLTPLSGMLLLTV